MIRDDRKRKKGKKIRRIIRWSFLLIVSLLALLIINVFTVKNVKVEGNKLYKDNQIKASVLNDKYSWNTLYVFLKYKIEKMHKVPFIDTMEIRVKSPTSLNIQVYEKGLIGYLYIDSLGQNVYFDKDGFVEETSTKVIPGVPKITGISSDKIVLYEKLNINSKSTLKNLLSLTQILKKYKLVPDTINYDTTSGITIYYGGVSVILGDASNLEEKVMRLSYIYPNLSGMSGVLHMENWTENTTDITFEKNQ